MWLFLLSALVLAESLDFTKDVCIFGAGASGMAAAAFLKDRNYDVVVLEERANIGGHCNTYYFTPPHQGETDWIDYGVLLYPDTKKAQASGYGTWAIDTVAFVKRFAGPNSVNLLNFTAYSALELGWPVDVALSLSLGAPSSAPAPPPTLAFEEAYGRYLAFCANYSWINNYSYPAVIPPALLVPFTQTIQTLNLSALNSIFFGFLTSSGVGNLSEVTTLAAISALTPLVLSITSTLDTGFTVNNGCVTIYEGITNYLGASNVITNFTTVSVIRPTGLFGEILPNVVIGYNSYNEKPYVYTCENIISAFPQTLDNFQGWDLDLTEKALFGQASWHAFYNGIVSVKGGPASRAGFAVPNVNPYDPLLTPVFPTITNVLRTLSYGPATVQAFSETNDLTQAQITAIVKSGLANISASGVLNTTLNFVQLHQYQPTPSNASLSARPNFYTKINNLQGHRDTYYTGALLTTSASYAVWNQALLLVEANFPQQ